MTIQLNTRSVVLKRQYSKRISLDIERSFFFFFFSVGWLCLAKLDESSKFGCFLPALLLLPFPICNAPPSSLLFPIKTPLAFRKKFYCRLLIMSNSSRSTSNTLGSAIPYCILSTIMLMVIIMLSLIKNSLWIKTVHSIHVKEVLVVF